MLHGVMRKHPTDKYDCKAVSQSAYAAMRESMKTLHTNSVETAIVRVRHEAEYRNDNEHVYTHNT